MLLVIDIGNTNITAGLFENNRLIKKGKVHTHNFPKQKKFFSQLVGKREVEKIIICCVVPQVLSRLIKFLLANFKVKPLVCGKDIIIPIKNLYKKPQQVGQDRLVGAFAVSQKYGTPAIVIDFGTAVTFDVISQEGEYLGGAILPGVDIAFDSLFEKTALLPMVKFKVPRDIIGHDTVNSIRSGVVYGYASLCDGMVKKFQKRVKSKPKVIATGGYAHFVAKYSDMIQEVDSNLVLEGLKFLALKKNS